jgi:hypothetical protein
MKDKRSKIEIRYAAIKRLIIWNLLNRLYNGVLITEFPKSGGTWFSQLIAESTNLPFPRNATPKFQRNIMHGHFLYNSNFGKCLGVIRDGRDIMVSAYYHFLFENDRNSSKTISKSRQRLPFENYDDIKSNMPRFIEYMFTSFTDKWSHFSWDACIRSFYSDTNVHIIKYEDLLINAVHEIEKALSFLDYSVADGIDINKVVSKFSFENQTKRKSGQEDKKSFLRKGISGDWINHFSKESRQVFNHYAGKELILAGYESDNNWV